MAILIDSNVLIDVAAPKSAWFDWSVARLRDARRLGEFCYNIVIATEVSYSFEDADAHMAFLDGFPARFESIPLEAAYAAATAHRAYRSRGGTRTRTLPDFLIGAHAQTNGYRILTRDPSGYRTYFPDVELIAPDEDA